VEPISVGAPTLPSVPPAQKIVVAFDDPASRTLARAADLAEALGSDLIVTNVAAADPDEAGEEARYGRERLEHARSYLEERGLAAEFVALTGQPAEAIVALAEERGADLIVVGMRKKGFLERLVEGSVAQDVMRRATSDVLAVH
jgi:nucleotide-binding universal stress UspA family protein